MLSLVQEDPGTPQASVLLDDLLGCQVSDGVAEPLLAGTLFAADPVLPAVSRQGQSASRYTLEEQERQRKVLRAGCPG